MAKKRTYPLHDDLMPSLFDDQAPVSETPATFPGMERHIRVMKKEYDRRQDELQQRNRRHEPSIKPMEEVAKRERVFFMSLGSGSSGNCSYVGTLTDGLLIDAGVDAKRVTEELQRNGIALTAVKGIVLTHDHGDHVRYAWPLLRTMRHMLLYCTPRVINGILRRHSISRRIRDYHKAIYKEIAFKLGGFDVTAFDVDHDGSDNAGFFLQRGDLKLAVATDLGVVGERADHYMRLAGHIVIESNYDCEMLMRGSYPEYLKARIMARNGHLDNVDTAAYVASIYTPALKHVLLCHLSEDNNTPQIARAAVAGALEAMGVMVGDCSNSPASREAAVQVMPLPRYDSTGLIPLD